MLTEEKIKKEKKSLRTGAPEGEIKNQLKLEGYSEEEIKSIFTPEIYDMRNWLLSFSIVFLLLGLYLFITSPGYPLLLLLLSAVLFYEYYKLDKKAKVK